MGKKNLLEILFIFNFTFLIFNCSLLPMNNKKTVLVVDDDASVRRLVTSALRKLNCEVLEARDGDEGLLVIRSHRPDLIVLDLMMPNIEGDEVLAKIGEDPSLDGMPVLIISGVKDRQRINRLMERTSTNFLPKPFSVAIFREKVKEMLEL